MKKYFLGLVCFNAVLFSCNEKQKKVFSGSGGNAYTYNFKSLPDTLLPPEIIEPAGSNAPQSFVIKPTVVPLKHPNGVESFSFKRFDIADGLSSNVIHSLAVDHSGNLWIGEIGGLDKYDGTSFTSFSTFNGLGSQRISRLLVDSGGTIWIGAWDGSYKYDGKQFLPMLKPGLKTKEITPPGIFHLQQGPDGSILAAGHEGFYYIKGDSIRHYGKNEGLPDGSVFGIAYLPGKGALIFTKAGNFLLTGGKFEPFTDIPTLAGWRPVHQDRNGNIWFWTGAKGKFQMAKFDGNSTVYYDEMSGKDIYFYPIVYEDRVGRIWLGTPGKLCILDRGNLVSYTFKELGIPNITTITEDKAGSIWLGSFDGLLKVSPDLVEKLEIPENIAGAPGMKSLVLGKDGVRWTSISQNLIRYDQHHTAIYDLKTILGEEHINCLYADKKGNVWLSSAKTAKLIHFDGEKFLTYNSEYVTKFDFINTISGDNAGNIVFISGGRLTLFNGKQFIRYGREQGFPGGVLSYFVDSKKRKWVGTNLSGVYIFSGDSVLQFNTGNGLSHNYVPAVTEDPFGNIWLATHGGVSRFNGKKLEKIGVEDGLGTLVSDILINPSDSLIWFAAVKGLFSIPFSEINSTSPRLTTYSPQNGYEIIHSSGSVVKTELDSAGIWMASVGTAGVPLRLNYKNTLKIETPTLELKNVRINNTNLLWSRLGSTGDEKTDSLIFINESSLKFRKVIDAERINELSMLFGKIEFDSLSKQGFIPANLRLPYSSNSITLEFSAISPSFGKFTQYRYKLKGYEENWSPYSTKNEAFFGNMNEGSYTFLLEAVTSMGTISTLSYSFTVLPPWYRTWWAYTLYALLFVSGIFLFIRWRTKALQIEKAILEEKVTTRTSELKESLENLKSTQSLLIQSEKMASLGELTAGIAHEIQNPLNFVNNFSEVNKELVDELKAELAKGDLQSANEIADDIKENSEKITHHGRRADAIVKGMLAHSRTSIGQMEITDINALAEEYLRLSWHGLKAKDPSFNASFHFEPDKSLPKVKVVPQDIGRVLLNLINNAFQAVSGYGDKPMVRVSIRQREKFVEITVADNGPGIPDSIKDKIFQPFFTTKPTGQGTGLGLSLSYDIVKAHGGELKLESKEARPPARAGSDGGDPVGRGEGSTFIIQLPAA